MSRVHGKRALTSLLLPSDRSSPDSLLDLLWEAELSSVWVMPATALSYTITCAWFEQVRAHWVAVVHPDPHDPVRPLSALFWPRGNNAQSGRRLTFVFPEQAGWNWTLADATSLLATVTYLQQLLSRPVLDPPDLLAHHLLTELTRSSPANAHTLSGHENIIAPLKSAGGLAWMRPLTLAEERQRYLHKYTHLSHALEGCIGVPLGIGEPQYSAQGRAFDGSRPGIWRVHVERAGSIFDGKQLPGCLDDEWMSTPMVKCCRDIGYRVHVQEGYYWQEGQDLLTRWATTLWQAGERLHTRPQTYRHAQARTNASHAITQLAHIGIDILAQPETSGGWSRPDWQAQITGRGRAILFAHLVRLVRRGTMPALVDRDALWVVSNDPDPLTAVRNLVTTPRWKGYTTGYEVPLPLSNEVKATFRSGEQAHQVALALDGLAGEAVP